MRQALHIPYDLQPLIFHFLSSESICTVYYLVYKWVVHHSEHHMVQEMWPEAPHRHKEWSSSSWEALRHLGSQNNSKLFIWDEITVLFCFAFLKLTPSRKQTNKKLPTTTTKKSQPFVLVKLNAKSSHLNHCFFFSF